MGAADCCAKAIIIIINIFFFLIGLAFLAGGIVFFVGRSLIEGALDDVIASVAEAANSTTDGSDLSAAAQFLDIFQPIFIALLVIGIFMIVTSILAMCGSCCSVNCMLISYVVIVLLIFVVHLALFISLMAGAFGGMIKTSLEDSIDEKYVGINDIGAYSVGWNLIMSQYQCCGVNSYRDFHNASKWDRFPEKDSEREREDPLETPVACCATDDGEIVGDYNCAYKPINDEFNNWKTGCWGVLDEKLVDPNRNIVIGVSCGILGFELVLVALTLCVIFQSRKKE